MLPPLLSWQYGDNKLYNYSGSHIKEWSPLYISMCKSYASSHLSHEIDAPGNKSLLKF